jgi:hypothetical protein
MTYNFELIALDKRVGSGMKIKTQLTSACYANSSRKVGHLHTLFGLSQYAESIYSIGPLLYQCLSITEVDGTKTKQNTKIITRSESIFPQLCKA